MTATDGGPTLANGGVRYWHTCGEPISVWHRTRSEVEFTPVRCPGCKTQLWRRDIGVTVTMVEPDTGLIG